MSMRAQVGAWTLAMGLIALPVAAQDHTEQELVEMIVRDGPQARAIRADAEITRREQLARLAYPNPTASYSREGAGFTEFLQVEQALPAVGVRAALARAGVAATTAAEARRDLRLANLRADARAAVARLSSWQARTEAVGRHARELARLIEILQTREREGEGSRFDRLRAEQELREAQQQAAAAGAGQADARASVTALMPAGAVFGRVGASEPSRGMPAAEELVRRAGAGHAELRAVQNRIAQAQSEGDVSRRLRLPSPVISGGLKRADGAADRETGGVFGVGVTVPLFDNGSRDVARWAAERSAAEADRAAIERRVHAAIRAAHAVLEIRQSALEQERAGAPGELLQIAEVAYREGEVGILELLDAVRTTGRAQVRGLELELDVRLAHIELERAMGGAVWP